MKKNKLIMFIIIALLIVVFPLTINAAQIDTDDYDAATKAPLKSSDLGQGAQIAADILATIRNVGIIISLIILTIIGIKYILGSIDEKAEYKGNMALYVAGVFLLMMATTIPSIIYDIMN